MTARIYYMIDYLTQGEHKIPVEMLRRPCLHLGPSTGESVLIFGCGCSSSKTNGIEVTVFECDIHNRCVTYSRGNLAEGSTMKRCLGCADNPVNRNPAK